jgi:hypothetical protein
MEKLYLLKLFQQLGVGEVIKDNGRGSELKYDIFDTLCKYHNVMPPSTTIKTIRIKVKDYKNMSLRNKI